MTLAPSDSVTSVTQAHLRVARPSRDLQAAERFWVDGLGLEVLFRSEPQSADALLMVGWPDAAWHIEFVCDPDVEPSPTDEDLLVLYLGTDVSEELVDSICQHGGRRVLSRNPYWDTWGVTLQDPDGYRLVLTTREWNSVAALPAT